MLGCHLSGGDRLVAVGGAEGECCHVVGDEAETVVVYQVGIVLGFVVG